MMKRNVMGDKESRRRERESLFLMADLRLMSEEGEHRVRLRNLSAGGMMAEGSVKAVPGALVEVNIRHIGWVPGAVAWVQDNRFGIALATEIDPKRVRLPAVGGAPAPAPAYVQPHLSKRASPGRPRRV